MSGINSTSGAAVPATAPSSLMARLRALNTGTIPVGSAIIYKPITNSIPSELSGTVIAILPDGRYRIQINQTIESVPRIDIMRSSGATVFESTTQYAPRRDPPLPPPEPELIKRVYGGRKRHHSKKQKRSRKHRRV